MLRDLETARTRLDQPAPADADIDGARTALRRLSVLAEGRQWTDLSGAARALQEAALGDLPGAGAPVALAGQLPATVRAALSEELKGTGLLEAGHPSSAATSPARLLRLVQDQFAELPDRDQQQVVVAAWLMPVVVVDGALVAVRRLAANAEEHAAKPAPATDPSARKAWVDRARTLLREAYAVASNILVAAAFSVPSVQQAAQEAARLAGDATRGVLPLLPSLLAISIMAALGVRLARDVAGIRAAP